jgi:hypothetical protein
MTVNNKFERLAKAALITVVKQEKIGHGSFVTRVRRGALAFQLCDSYQRDM